MISMFNIWSLTIFVFLFIFLIFIKLAFELACLRSNCKIKFELNYNLSSLKNVNIKFKNKRVEVSIDKLWLSSSSINKSINRLVSFCFNEIIVKVHSSDENSASKANGIVSDENQLDLDQIFSSYVLTILKLIGVCIDQLSIELDNGRYLIKCKKIGIDIEKEQKLKFKFDTVHAVYSKRGVEVKFSNICINVLYHDFKQRFYSSTRFKLQAIQVHVQNPCVKLSKKFSLKEYLASKQGENGSDNGSSSFFLQSYAFVAYQIFATKLVLFKIDKLNVKIFSNDRIAHDLVISEIKYLTPSIFNGEFIETVSYIQQQQVDSTKFIVKSIICQTQDDTQNILLNKFILTLNSFKNISLSGYCDAANLYLNLDLLQTLIDFLSYKLYLKNKNDFFSSYDGQAATQRTSFQKNFKNLLKKQIFIEFKILNTSLHLQSSNSATYSFSVRKLFSKYSRLKTQFSNETCVDLSINSLVLFKSNTTANLTNSFLDKLANLNTTKTHFLDTVLHLNILELKFQMQKLKYNFDLFVDNLHFEYNLNDLVKIRRFLQAYECLFDNMMFYLSIKSLTSVNKNKNQQLSEHGNKKVKLKVMFKTLNFYLIQRGNICVYFETNDAYFNNDNSRETYLKDTKTSATTDSFVIQNDESKFTSYNLYIKKMKCLKFHIQNSSSPVETTDLKQSWKFIQTSNYSNFSVLVVKNINFRKYTENANVDKSRIVYKRLYLNIQDVQVTWSLNTHLMVFETYKKFSLLTNTVRVYLDKSKLFFTPPAPDAKVKQHPVVSKFNIVLESDVIFNINVDYGQDSSMKSQLKQFISITPTNLYLFITQNGVKASAASVAVNIDEGKFVRVQNFVMTFLKKDTTLQLERKSLNTEIELNRLLFLKFDSVTLRFSHDYDYAKLIDHLINFRKFFRILHNPKANKIDNCPVKQPLPLPCDLILKVNKVRIEIEDDPFEVKLAYNYALMLDEHHESVKRRQKLDERQLIKDRHLENEAHEILKEREAYVYMQRSKKMYEKPVRTQLFTWSASDIDMHAIIDTKWNGTENCIKMIKKIDKDSTLPANVKFLILWARYVNLNIKNTKLMFRDYAQPFLQSNEFHVWGYFLASEIEPSQCAIREIIMTLDESNMKFKLQRSISPLKFYHDLSAKIQFLSVAYGPCKEGAMAQINLALDRIIHPPRNPSLPLPWWDKTRLYLHGRLSATVEQMQWVYHVSMDPYNRTEEMKWIWSNLYLDWTNMKMLFAGNLEIFLNTASKYDDCRIIYWPNLEMLLKIEWLCKQGSNPNDHNYVMPSMADKVPIESLRTYDAYQFFRSENVNIKFKFNSMPNLRGTSTSMLPTMKFYASTLRFLQRIKDMLASVTRPTKRGKIFLNFKPRKPLLSRHMKFVHFQFYVPKFDIVYWSSASEQYGFQIECSAFSIDSTHKLELLDPCDKLIRRQISSWSIELMELKTTQTLIYLKSPSKEHKSSLASNSSFSALGSSEFSYDNEFSTVMENERSIKFLDSAPVIRNFLLQIDAFSYKRQPKVEKKVTIQKHNRKISEMLQHKNTSSSKEIGTNSVMLNVDPPLHKIQIVNLKAKWNNVNRDVVYTLYDIYHKAKVLRHNLSSMALKQIMLQENSQIFIEKYVNEQRDKPSKGKLFRNSSSISSEIENKKQMKPNVSLNELQFKGSYADEMLKKLESERGINSVVYINDTINETANCKDLLYGVHAATKMNDCLAENIHIEFINSQIKMNLQSLSGIKKISPTNGAAKMTDKMNNDSELAPDVGYLIISAANTHVIQRLHQPVWRHRRLLDKITWNGHLECMQYFATLKPIDNQNESPLTFDNDFKEYWLSNDVIDPSKTLSKPSPNGFFDMYCNKNTLGMIISPSFDPQKNFDERHAPKADECSSSHSEKLQLIASKCRCEFFIVDFNDKIMTEETRGATSDSQQHSFNIRAVDLSSSFKEPFDCFTLVHDELNLCTNPSQFQMILEIVNNLVLYFRPKKKQVVDRQKSLKFNLQLSGDTNSLKEYIMQKQIEIKEILSKLRTLERQIFYLAQKIELETENLSLQNRQQQQQQQAYSLQELQMENISMEKEYKELKKLLSSLSDELSVSISCFKEVMLEQRIMCLKRTSITNLNQKTGSDVKSDANSMMENSAENSKSLNGFASHHNLSFFKSDHSSDVDQQLDLVNEIGRRYEIWFKQVKWKLTEPDGVNECSQFIMKNFLYTKVANQQELDCVEHTLEVESVKIQDLTPDQSADNNDVLNSQFDYTLDNDAAFDETRFASSILFPENKTVMLRIFCKQRPPVNYISVIEHLEVNISPIRIRLTHRFYSMMMKFFFEMEDIKRRIPNGKQSKSNGKAAAIDDFEMSNKRGLHDTADFVNEQMKMQFLIANGENVKNDDIEIMKKRAASNNTFICIKIPEIPLLVSYKGGNKENNIKDLNNVRLLFPLFEAYNKTYTWLDLINAIKTHLKKALVSQAIKHKLIKIPIKPVNNLIRRTKHSNRNSKNEDYEKTTLLKLFGTKLIEKRSNSPSLSLEETSMISHHSNNNNESMTKDSIKNF